MSCIANTLQWRLWEISLLLLFIAFYLTNISILLNARISPSELKIILQFLIRKYISGDVLNFFNN